METTAVAAQMIAVVWPNEAPMLVAIATDTRSRRSYFITVFLSSFHDKNLASKP
jgi:hypothetical protein